MTDTLIVVVNREQARFFTLEPVSLPEIESGPRLVECQDLINPEAMMGAQERYTDSKTGRGSAPGGSAVHGYDDKRDQHLDEIRKRFAARVLEETRRLAKRKKASTIVVASSPRMGSFIYPGFEIISGQGYQVRKITKNIIKLPPRKIHAQLAAMELVPEQKRLTPAWR